jgi:hypothetical protein
VAAALGVALGLVAAATAMLPAASVRAVTEAPDSQAWWSISNQGAVPDPAVPPDVKPTDLYIAGLGGDKQAPASLPAPFPSGLGDRGAAAAISALRFTVPTSATIDKLTLHFDGSPPASVDLIACRTTVAFIPEQDGPWNDVPPYDCSVPSAGTLSSDGALVFPDIGALRRGTVLSLVVVPQYADRTVLAKPDANALSMRAPLPSFNSGGPPSFAAAAPASSSTGAVSSGSIPLTAPAGAPVRPALPAPSAPARPVPATPSPSPTASSAQTTAVPAPSIDDARARLAAGLFLGAALLAFLALAAGDASWLGRLLGVRTARLAPVEGPRPRGVGRFARPRDGRPEPL